MTTIEAHDGQLPEDLGAPTHRQHLSLSPPTTDDPDLARAIAVICCATLVVGQDDAAHCQLDPHGSWQSATAMRAELAPYVADASDDKPIDDFMSLAEVPFPLAAEPAHPAPQATDEAVHQFSSIRDAAPRRIGGFGRKGL